MKKILGIIKNAIIIAVASVLFPIIMNKFFGFEIPMDTDSIISFMLLGLGVYFVYLVAKSIYKMLKFTERFAKEKVPKMEKSSKKEEKPKEEKEDKKENKRREKNLEEREKALSKREQELRWKASLQKKSGKDWTKEYHTLEDSKAKVKDDSTIDVSRSPITPLPVIEHKEKKKKRKKEED